MNAIEIVSEKRNGKTLSPQQLGHMVKGFTRGSVSAELMASFLMSVCLNGLNRDELGAMTLAMAESGSQLDLANLGGPKVDKHSSGGVGDKTTMIVAPLVASLGVMVPKISGRGLGHTGGTIDKIESIPGLKTRLSEQEFFGMLKSVGMVIASQSENMVPADEKIYALRNQTATVDCIPLIAASIMSKKIASGARAVVLDVKVGKGGFMQCFARARVLAETMVEIGNDAGMKTVALLTRMQHPLGLAVGNSLEVKEAIDTLKGGGPADLREICLSLATEMVSIGLDCGSTAARAMSESALDSKDALRKFGEFVKAQGGDIGVVENPDGCLPKARFVHTIKSSSSGYLSSIDALSVGKAALILSTRNFSSANRTDNSAGIVFQKSVGDEIMSGERLASLYTNDERTLDQAKKLLFEAITIGDTVPKPLPIVLERIA